MFPSDSRQLPPERRARRRTPLAAPERLESRELMTTGPLGFSIPDLAITGSAGTRAAFGGQLGVIATVLNQGTSTITNPIAQYPGAPSTADALSSTVSVYITPHRALNHAVRIGTFQAPAVIQNSVEQVAEAFTLPTRDKLPPAFRGTGTIYVHLVINQDQGVLESDLGNNASAPLPVHIIRQALPQVDATDLAIAPAGPGDTIVPTISVANDGTAPTTAPVQVALVASTTRNFSVGSSIVALYDITTSIPAASEVPPGGTIAAFSQTLTPLNNTVTFTGPPVTLPVSPRKYYLGLVIDPYAKLQQLKVRSSRMSQVRVIGPESSGLPPAGVISTPNNNPFPLPPSGNFIGVNPTTNNTTSSNTVV